jgi:DNA-binding GntR family transcriptional regulator
VASRTGIDSSMREAAYAHIRNKIASRELPAGAPVAELPIARELGISRTPTREALRQLIAEGLLEEVPGRGAMVPRLSREDLIELYDMREALETHAVQSLATTGLSGDNLASARKIAAELRDLAADLRRSRAPHLDDAQMERFESSGKSGAPNDPLVCPPPRGPHRRIVGTCVPRSLRRGPRDRTAEARRSGQGHPYTYS